MTLLTQTLHPDNLRRAWEAVADNGGIPGVDDVSIRTWRRTWEARLAELARAVRANRYRASPLRERRIPKTTPGEWRTLRIPTVTDRVLQRAVLQQLYPIVEPRFLDCSFGYRPGRGLRDAVRAITRLRRQGHGRVLDADIDDFFNQVDHSLLFDFLLEDLPDQSLNQLLRQWLTADCLTPDCNRGIPMGSPVSPLLANVYLHRLDMHLTACDHPHVRYADDFIVLARDTAGLQQAYDDVASALAALKLRYEPRKTRLTSFDDGFSFLGVHFEQSWYWYTYEDKRIEVRGDRADWLFGDYGPDYDQSG